MGVYRGESSGVIVDQKVIYTDKRGEGKVR